MAAGNDAQSAVALVPVGQLKPADDHAAAHPAFCISVAPRSIKALACRAMPAQPLRATR